LDGSSLKHDAIASIKEKLNPSKMLNPSVFRIDKLVSLNGEMGRLLTNFNKVKNAGDGFKKMRAIQTARRTPDLI
jgi:hypothetical protein